MSCAAPIGCVMDTLMVMDKIRKLTLSKPFSMDEFKQFTGTDGDETRSLLNAMFLDCYLQTTRLGMLEVVHGKERRRLIDKKIQFCKNKINEWYEVHNHLKSL